MHCHACAGSVANEPLNLEPHAICPLSEVIIYCSATAGAWPLSAERKIEVSAEQRLQIYVVNGSDGRCLVAVRLIVGVRYLERPLREVLPVEPLFKGHSGIRQFVP